MRSLVQLQSKLSNARSVLLSNNLDGCVDYISYPFSTSRSDITHTLVRMDVLVVLAQLGLGAGCVDRTVGEGLALLQTRGDRQAVHSAGLLVLLPSGAGDVATDDGFDGEDAELADLHAAVLQHRAQRGGDLGGKIQREEVGAQTGDFLCQDVEPCLSAEGEEDALVRDSLYIKTESVIISVVQWGRYSIHSP